jgi:ribosomal protein L11 methyltransferase
VTRLTKVGPLAQKSEMSSYFRIRLFNVPSNKEDEITHHCIKSGSNGLSEALAYNQPDLTYDPDLIPKRAHDLDAYFDTQPGPQFYEGLRGLLPSLKWEMVEEQHKDWLIEWKKGFVPFKLAGPYWVVPSWLESPTTPENTITIDPGMAFGTGTHATTKMASYFVHKLCSKVTVPSETSLIDVGTGTGILAMLAKKHGIGHVVGIEIDPEARRVSRENIKLNNLNDIEVPETLLEEIDETFDIVVANIIDGVLVQIKNELINLLNPSGQLFLTGILLEREETFFQNFIENSPLTVIRRIEQDEWVGYWVQLKS